MGGRVCGVIPARWGSTRLPGKSLVPLCGKPLVQWVYERARRATRLERLLVATDDRRIVEAVEAFGGEAVMTRADHPSGTDRVAEAVAGLALDVVINIQGDEPLIDPALIDRLAATMLERDDLDMATAATPVRHEEEARAASVVKVVTTADGLALYFSRALIPCVRDADFRCEGPLHWRHLGVYAYRKAFLGRLVATAPCLLERAEKLEQLRALHLGARMAVLETRDEGIGVDTPEDVAYAEALIRKQQESGVTR